MCRHTGGAVFAASALLWWQLAPTHPSASPPTQVHGSCNAARQTGAQGPWQSALVPITDPQLTSSLLHWKQGWLKTTRLPSGAGEA